MVNVIFKEPPETPRQLRVVNSSSRTANLTWQHPFDGRSEITSFLIQYKKHYRKYIVVFTLPCNVYSTL